MEINLIEIARKMALVQWVVVVTLLGMAVASASVFFERLWSLVRSGLASRRFAPEASRLVKAGQVAGLALVDDGKHPSHPSHLARLLSAGAKAWLAANQRPSPGLTSAQIARRELGRERERIEADMNRGLGVLASTGSVAPFVGLLGTVLGIVAAFEGIAKSGGGGLGAVSAGISEALVVTALGLIVAIPSVLAFNHLSTRIENLLRGLEHAAGELADHLEGSHDEDADEVMEDRRASA